MPGGKPEWVPNEETYEQIEELAEEGYMTDQVSVALGICPATFYNKQKIYPEMAAAYKRGRIKSNGAVTSAMFEKAKKGDTGSMVFWLCNRDPDNWQNVQKREHTGKDGGPIETTQKVIRMTTQSPNESKPSD